MALIATAAVLFGSMSLYFRQENAKREKGGRDSKMEGRNEEEVLAMGDANPRFRFAT